ncbi:MAG: replicative DNA helicase [Gammaproteobacteria bacterium]|jgi:replicative DNA helicase|nr:replicative DNA helicase [Gammaproteobacteria bacterium]MDG2119072.1 replicative DNA helicase [Gammaproteobacteria bacterium]|tara:strand:+ start:3558 stop:4970 length:1413 start_codon:yes stop_codon:yes gene_type:complete
MANPLSSSNDPVTSLQGLSSLKLPPHSADAEQAVLGGLMLDNTEWDNLSDLLVAEDFYRQEHQIIYAVMSAQSEANQPIDVVTVMEALNSRNELQTAGGLDYLSELSANARGTANIKYYAEIVRDRAVLRRIISTANKIADSSYNTGGRDVKEVLDEAEQAIFTIADERPETEGPVAVNPLLSRAAERIDELSQLKGGITGLSTGYTELDKMTSGWQKSDLVIVAGRPSMGKTAFAMNLVEEAVLNNPLPVLVFSLEMPAESLIFRMLSSIGRINQSKLRNGDLSDEDWRGFNSAFEKLKDTKLFIDDSPGLSPMDMRSRVRRLKREHGDVGMVVIDYLQLMQIRGTSENRTGEISEISRSLKLLAREFKCPVIALSQLNRSLEQRPNKRPVMSDLRESGAIEQDADVITFIYRDEVYNEDSPEKGVAEIIIGKQRNGPIGTLRLSFLGEFTRFENYAPPRYDDSYTHGH